MWAVVRGNRFYDYTVRRTRVEAIFALEARTYELWADRRKRGDRAVKVTVTWETPE
jgi:hypothetical protein